MPISSPIPYTPALRQNIARYRAYAIPGGAVLAANTWWGMILACPVPFSAVRLGFQNFTGAAAGNVNAVYIQPIEDPTAAQPFTGVMSDTQGARGPSGNQLVTFNNAGADGTYPSPAGATTTLAIPGGPAAPQSLQMFYSDWYAMPNGAYPSRIGAGAVFDGFYYLGIIVQAGAGPLRCGLPSVAGDLTAFVTNSLVLGSTSFHMRDVFAAAAGPTAFNTWVTSGRVSLATANELSVISSIDVMTPGRVFNVGLLSDSQLSGFDANSGTRPTTDLLGPVHRACLALSSAATPMVYTNMAAPAQDFDNWINDYAPSLSNASTGPGEIASSSAAGPVLPVMRPDVLIYPWCSPNDNTFAPNRQTCQDHFYKSMELARWCQRGGIVPVICTVPPASGRYSVVNSYFKSPSDLRIFYNAQLRAQAAINPYFKLLDVDAIMSDGGSPPALQTALAQGDGIHFSDAGNIAVQNALQPILKKIVGLG